MAMKEKQQHLRYLIVQVTLDVSVNPWILHSRFSLHHGFNFRACGKSTKINSVIINSYLMCAKINSVVF